MIKSLILDLPVKLKEGFILKEKRNKWIWLFLSFLIPFMFVGIGFIRQGVHPFGERQILVTDFWHQYYPYLRLLHEKLQTGGSMLYTWDSGMGSNFLSIMAYYTASPLNLITILVPESLLRDTVTFILLVKIGLAGLFFAVFLKGVFGKNDFSLCCFSILYALCSYIMGYYWNIIWLDTVAILPLVILGLVKLVRDGSYRLYVVSLALALFSNYYIGFFVCIFTALSFFCVCIIESTGIKKFFLSGFKLILFTALGICLSSILLIPAYFALQNTYSIENTFPTAHYFYESWKDLLANMIGYHNPTVKEGLPNIYCGVICIVLSGVFFCSSGVKIREKVLSILLLGFILLSCNLNILNYIWHGFHFTNMLPYRFSFLFSFVLVLMSYRAFLLVLERKINILSFIAMAIIGVVFIIIAVNSQDLKSIIYTAITMALYILCFIIYKYSYFMPKILYGCIAIVLCIEMNSFVKLSTEGVSTSDYTSYPTKYKASKEVIDSIEKQEEDTFSRAEFSSTYTLNDPALYGYSGISQFSSTANSSVTTFLKKIGLPASEAGNRYYYAFTSPVTNMFTGIKYIMNRSGVDLSATDTIKQNINQVSNDVILYENQYSLPIGFMTEYTIEDFSVDSNESPFIIQNNLFALATGIEEPLFTSVDVKDVGHSGLTATRNSYGSYTYSLNEDTSTETYLKYNFLAENDTELYAYFSVKDVSSVRILKDELYENNIVLPKQPYIFPMGIYKSGQTASLQCEITEKTLKSGLVTIYVYALNNKVLNEGYKKLRAGGIDITKYSDTKIKGNITSKRDGLCYFSIPYEEGWSAEVDGHVVETRAIGEAMLAVPVSSGTHEIVLKYIPKGFKVGVTLSICSIAILVFLYYIEKRSCKSKILNEAEQLKYEEEEK